MQAICTARPGGRIGVKWRVPGGGVGGRERGKSEGKPARGELVN